MNHISYPSTEQFASLIGNINRTYNFEGLDENGKAIYDPSKPKPVLDFVGTVKLHGTAFYVCYNDANGIWFQSRENVITPTKDNAGSAIFGEMNKDALMEIIEQVYDTHNLGRELTVMICSEWAGKGVQKNVGISNIPKAMFIYGIKIVHDGNDDFVNYYIDYAGYRNVEKRIFNMLDFKTYNITVDFNMPQLVQNHILELVLEVENECPVAKELIGTIEPDMSMIGEGIVFSRIVNGTRQMFKAKGERHAGASKVKTIRKVDDAKLNLVLDFVDKITPEWRLEQMLDKTFDLMNGGHIERSKMGDYIKAVMADIIKEEMLTFQEAGLEMKDVSKYAAEEIKKYFFQREKELLGL